MNIKEIGYWAYLSFLLKNTGDTEAGVSFCLYPNSSLFLAYIIFDENDELFDVRNLLFELLILASLIVHLLLLSLVTFRLVFVEVQQFGEVIHKVLVFIAQISDQHVCLLHSSRLLVVRIEESLVVVCEQREREVNISAYSHQ